MSPERWGLPLDWPGEVLAVAESAAFVPAVAADLESIRALAAGLGLALAEPHRPLRILLLGGTGGGRSTLLNALAGARVAPAGELRPTTRTPVLYRHEDDPLPDLGGLEQRAEIRSHRRPDLAGKAVLDAPDPDSDQIENRRLLEQALPAADLVVAVASPEKYLSAVVFELLRKYRTGRHFVFVLNKIDQVLDQAEDVGRDLARELAREGFEERPLLVSAAGALANRLSGGALPEGEFTRLARLLGEQLDRVRALEIRTRNVSERAGDLAARVERHLPAGLPGAAAEWRARTAERTEDLLAQAGARVGERLRRDPDIQEWLVRSAGAGFSSLFGAAAAVGLGLRAWLRGGPAAGLAGPTDRRRIAARLLPEPERERLLAGLQGAIERFALDSRELGLADDAVAEMIAAELPRGWAEGLAQRSEETLAGEIEALLAVRPGPGANFAANLAPWLAALALAGRMLWNWLAAGRWEWDAVTGSVVLLGLLLALELALVRRLLAWGVRRRLRAAARRAELALRAAYTDTVAGALDRTTAAVLAPGEKLARLTRLLPPARSAAGLKPAAR